MGLQVEEKRPSSLPSAMLFASLLRALTPFQVLALARARTVRKHDRAQHSLILDHHSGAHSSLVSSPIIP